MNLIFDFDGTLVNSFDRVMAIYNVLANEFHFKKIELSDYAEIRNLSSKELIQYLNIPLYKIPSILYRAREQMKNEIRTLSFIGNLPDVLKKMHDAHISLGILTSNSEDNVIAWLENHNLKQLFNFIYAESNYFGKAHILKKLLKKYEINKQLVFYIGDETRDIEAAKQNGIQSIAVTWGFNSEEILVKHHPSYIVRKPDELLSIINLNYKDH